MLWLRCPDIGGSDINIIKERHAHSQPDLTSTLEITRKPPPCRDPQIYIEISKDSGGVLRMAVDIKIIDEVADFLRLKTVNRLAADSKLPDF